MMGKLYEYLRDEIYTKLYRQFEELLEKLSGFLSIKIESNNNWTLLLAIFVINVSLYYLCDQMNTLNQIRQQPDVEDDEESYKELTVPAKADILPGDETITTVEVLDKDENGHIKFIPVTLTARLSSKIIDYKNSLTSLWMNMFVNNASATTIEKHLESMQDDLNANMTSRAPYQGQTARNTEISESFLDLLQRTTAAQCRAYGNSLSGLLHMRIGYLYKDKEHEMPKEQGEKVTDVVDEYKASV